MAVSQIIGASIADGTIAAIDITDGTITSSKLATTTGSGSVVLSTSPTITGNLTVSGTQTNSALTSGRITYASTGGLLTDSSALTFDGTTVTATKFAGALNGSLGATTPSTVVATSVTNSSLTAGRVTYANTGGLLTDSSNLQFNGTNLGVGVTPSAWFSVYRAIQIGGNFSGSPFAGALTGQTNDAVISLTNNAYVNTSVVDTYYSTASYGASRYKLNANVHEWLNAPAGTAGNAITFTQAMTLDASGYLGIGTTTPSSYGGLAVRKAATVSSVPVSASFSDSANSTFDIRHSPNIVNLNAQGSGITINTGNSTKMTITDAGLVGIGAASPSVALEVAGSAKLTNGNLSIVPSTTTNVAYLLNTNASGNFFFAIDNSTGASFTGTAYARAIYSGGAYPMVFLTNDTERMRITSAGLVGIGTSSPNQKLTLGSSDGTQALSFVTSAYLGDNALIGNIEFSTNGAGGGYDNLVNIKAYKTGTNTNSGDLTFWTKNDGSVSEKVRITKSGQVGIGTTDPIRPLQIGAYGSGNGEMAIASGTSGYGSILFGDGASGSDYYRGYIQYQHSGDYMLFATATVEAMRINSTGSLSLTKTGASPVIRRQVVQGSYGLIIQGNASDTINDANPGASVTVGGGPLDDTYEGNVSITAYGAVSASGNRNAIMFRNRSGTDTTTERMRIDYAGNVGIGTSSPGSYRLKTVGAGFAFYGTNYFNVGVHDGSAAQRGIALGYNSASQTGIIAAETNSAASNLAFFTFGGVSWVEGMRITSDGRIRFISRSSYNGEQDAKLQWVNENSNGVMAQISCFREATPGAPGALLFYTSPNVDTNQYAPIERMRINSAGFSHFLGSGSYYNSAAVWHSFESATADDTFLVINSHASSPYGMQVFFSGAVPNNNTFYFYSCFDTSATRFKVYANGGIANYQANDANLSDRREKTNFAPATSYLEKICSIPVQTFNYIDQNREEDDGLTLGVVAQDVQAVAPELVTESNWGTKEEPKMRLSIYQTDLQYALMKCIQEQQALIESLTTRLTALEGK